MAFDYISEDLQQRKSESLLRDRVCIENNSNARELFVSGTRYLNFASNDYLGLGSKQLDCIHSDLQTGSLSSALVTGYQSIHSNFEKRLCKLLGYESALLFSSGFSANSSVLKALFSQNSAKDSAIFQDKLNHASLIDGALNSTAKHVRFNHNDINHLRQRLEKTKAANKLIISEGVFSMDGDCAPIHDIAKLASDHNAWMMIDDAHSFGVVGDQGLGSIETGIKPNILVITFGKAMASQGAAVLASKSVIDYLLQFNRDYIYSTAMSPLMVEAADFQLTQLLNAHTQRKVLKDNIRYFKDLCLKAKIPLMSSDTPIQPVILGSADATLFAQSKLREKGIWLTAIRPPTVAHNTSRLRITINASHSQEDIKILVDALRLCI